MERKILEYINEHPYCRQRYIASAYHIWLCDKNFLNALYRLHKDGFIDCESHNDSAQMEFFNLWYLTDKGKRAIMNIENKEGV